MHLFFLIEIVAIRDSPVVLNFEVLDVFLFELKEIVFCCLETEWCDGEQ